MQFALLGGDGRFARLVRLLRSDGHAVRPFALEQAVPDCAESAEAALEAAEAVILPLPCEKNGALNAPFSNQKYAPEELMRHAAPGTRVLAGKPEAALRAACRERGLPLADYNAREDFALRNAVLTAEGALPLLLDGPKALDESHILIAGFGRIGRALAQKLRTLGARVTVAARSPAARRAAEGLGCAALTLETAPGKGYDAAVNTIPETVFGQAALEAFGDNIKLIELASPPYGFDFDAAEGLGNPVYLAAGLPGKTAPESAAAAIRDAIYAILKEQSK